MDMKMSSNGLQRAIAALLIATLPFSVVAARSMAELYPGEGVTIAGVPFFALAAQNPASQPATSTTQGNFRIRVETELVLVNVVTRDKQGRPIQDLKAEDFTLLEDGKPQHISSFDAENLDTTPAATTAGAGPSQQTINEQPVAPAKPP